MNCMPTIGLRIFLIATLVSLIGILQPPARSATAMRKPNIVFILVDDLGYGDVQANNPGSRIPTPAINRLAAEGMRFTDAHSPSAVCTPTRYGILTGRYCWRTRLERGVLWGIDGSLIDPNRTTIADMLRDQGYTTACIGKWHLGMDFRDSKGNPVPGDRKYELVEGIDRVDYSKSIGNSPLSYGFDYSYVITGSLNMFPYAYIEGDRFTEAATEFIPRTEHNITIISGGPKAPNFDFEAVVDVFTGKAVSFIQESSQAEKPFFLYFPLTAPHKPVLPTSAFKGKSEYGIYGDFVMQVDDVVAQIDAAMEASGARKNTLLIFTSDNGSFMYRLNDDEADHIQDFRALGYYAENHQSNYIWRGTKADIYEAGHRVPTFVRWPGVVESGSVCDETITHTDWFATFAEMHSRSLRSNEAEDSFSLISLMKGSRDWQRAPVIHHSSSGMFAIREGRWKLIAGNGSGGRQNPRGAPFEQPYQLYDLQSDPSETRNLIDSNPEIASRLETELESIRSRGRSR
jgi:arylsulfatase A